MNDVVMSALGGSNLRTPECKKCLVACNMVSETRAIPRDKKQKDAAIEAAAAAKVQCVRNCFQSDNDLYNQPKSADENPMKDMYPPGYYPGTSVQNAYPGPSSVQNAYPGPFVQNAYPPKGY